MMQLDEVSRLTGLSIDALAKRCQRGELAGEKVPKKPGSKILVWALSESAVKEIMSDSGKLSYEQHVTEWQEQQRNGRLTKKRLSEKTIEINTFALENYWRYLKQPDWKHLKKQGLFDASKIRRDISDITAENFEICMANWEKPDREKQNCRFAWKINTYKAVRSFCKYLIKVGLKPKTILDDLEEQRPKQIYEPQRLAVSKDELRELLNKNQDNLEGGRDEYDVVLTDMIVKILGLAGLRISELLHIKLSHFSARKKELFVPASISKTHRDREIGLRPDLLKAIQHYVKYHRPSGGSDNLLLQKDGKPITVSVVRGRLKRSGKKAGLKRSHPHMYRRAFATIHADMGVPITHLRDQLGHTSESTTELYLRTDKEIAKQSLKTLEVDDFKEVKPKAKTLQEKLSLIDKL